MKNYNDTTLILLALTWSHHQRMTQLCSFLGVPLEEIITQRKGIVRYIYLANVSWRFLYQRRPNVVLIQSPSLVLALFCVLVKHLLGFRLVIDAHNESVEPFINKSLFMRVLTIFVLKHCELIIVTNKFLAEKVKKVGGEPFILPDRIPMEKAGQKEFFRESGDDLFSVAVICTGAPDEPIQEILDAARLVGNKVSFYVTGSLNPLFNRLGANLPGNVMPTGFLDEDDYWNLLRNCNAVLDLTKMPDCLVCGAYEALAVETPMILTKNRASENLFGEYAVLIDNNAPDIAGAVQEIRENRPAFLKQLHEHREIYQQRWDANGADLKNRLVKLCRS